LRPSDLRTFAFCPRLYFFEVHLEKRITLVQRIKMLLGKIRHFILELRYEEREVEALGELFGRKVFGRADAVEGDYVVEVKSSRGPEDGAWFGDYLQASVYALVLGKRRIKIKYSDGERELEPDPEELEEVIKLFELVREGYVPPPKRSRWCSKCPFRDLCEELGEEGDGWFPRLPYVKR